MLSGIPWYLGPLVLVSWVAVCLWLKVKTYETPMVELQFYEHTNNWFLRVRNKSRNAVSCTINFDDVRKSSGERVISEMCGLCWNGSRSNPVGINGLGSWETPFAKLVGGNARLLGTSAAVEMSGTNIVIPVVPIDLTKGEYDVTLAVHAGTNFFEEIKLFYDGSKVNIVTL